MDGDYTDLAKSLASAGNYGTIALETVAGDETPYADGSMTFNGGMFSNQRASKLAANQYSDGQNVDTDQLGQVTTRRGTALVAGTTGSATSSSVQGLTFFDTPSKHLLLQVANKSLYEYSGSEWLISGTAYQANSASLNIEFAQMVNQMYWVDGYGQPYRYDGTTISGGSTWTYTSGTTTVACTMPANGCTGIINHQNRLVTWGETTSSTYAQQTLYISDALVPNFPTVNTVVVGGGDGDPIVGCLSWIQQKIVVFKQRAVHLVDTTGGVGSSATIQRLHNRIGCACRRTIAQIGADKLGNDVFFLARDGVRSLITTISNGEQGISAPISYPINDWIQRINWAYVSTACGFYWNNRYLIALPIDSATSPNYVFVYHTINQSWSGYWTGWTPNIFCIEAFSQNPKLDFGDSTGKVLQWRDFISVASEADTDYQDNGTDIATNFKTKAYTFNQIQNNKLGFNLECEFYQSLAKNVNITVKKDEGSTTTAILAFDTSSRTGFTPPITLPLVLPPSGIRRASTDLMQFGEFREIEVGVTATAGKVALRTINLMAFTRLPQTIYGT